MNDFTEDLPVIKGGELRVYLADKIVDVVPRMGRVIIFNSEKVEHEVRPTLGYDRYAITVWAHQIVPQIPEKECQEDVKNELNKIFVGIPSYRDSELPFTVRSLLGKAKFPKRLVIAIFLQHKVPECETDAETLKLLE